MACHIGCGRTEARPAGARSQHEHDFSGAWHGTMPFQRIAAKQECGGGGWVACPAKASSVCLVCLVCLFSCLVAWLLGCLLGSDSNETPRMSPLSRFLTRSGLRSTIVPWKKELKQQVSLRMEKEEYVRLVWLGTLNVVDLESAGLEKRRRSIEVVDVAPGS